MNSLSIELKIVLCISKTMSICHMSIPSVWLAACEAAEKDQEAKCTGPVRLMKPCHWLAVSGCSVHDLCGTDDTPSAVVTGCGSGGH